MSTKIQRIIKDLLTILGEDPEREGLRKTPKRVAKMYEEILSGYKENVNNFVTAFKNEGSNDLVVIKDIEFYSLCEHHMVPFFGHASIGYLPNKKILGLSKFARITHLYSKRLQVQERLTRQILNAVVEILDPRGAAVKIQAKHLCMAMRGIKQNGSTTTSTAYYGLLESDFNLRNEFLNHLLLK